MHITTDQLVLLRNRFKLQVFQAVWLHLQGSYSDLKKKNFLPSLLRLLLRCTSTFSGEVNVIYIFASLLKRVYSQRKEFAPLSSCSRFFPLRVNPSLKSYVSLRSKREVTKVIPLGKNGEKHGGVPIHLK